MVSMFTQNLFGGLVVLASISLKYTYRGCLKKQPLFIFYSNK